VNEPRRKSLEYAKDSHAAAPDDVSINPRLADEAKRVLVELK
jgi:hypothetical protein